MTPLTPGYTPSKNLEPVEVKVQEVSMQDVAVCAIYLMHGYETLNALRNRSLGALPTQDNSGHNGLAYRFAELALMMEQHRLSAVPPDAAYTGVLEYEVFESMGRWFYAHENDNDVVCSTELFMAEYREQLKMFFNEGADR